MKSCRRIHEISWNCRSILAVQNGRVFRLKIGQCVAFTAPQPALAYFLAWCNDFCLKLYLELVHCGFPASLRRPHEYSRIPLGIASRFTCPKLLWSLLVFLLVLQDFHSHFHEGMDIETSTVVSIRPKRCHLSTTSNSLESIALILKSRSQTPLVGLFRSNWTKYSRRCRFWKILIADFSRPAGVETGVSIPRNRMRH